MWSELAGDNLTGKLFYCAVIKTDGTIGLAGDDATVAGIIYEEAAVGFAATIQVSGIAKVILGATLNPGVLVEAKSDGSVEAFTTGPAVGVLLKGGNSGEIVPIKLY
jgi:hypothetical protein